MWGMPEFVLKFYRRHEAASKVVASEPVIALDKTLAIERAKVLFAERYNTGEFAMLFVSGGDLVWVSEKSHA
jgi:hypothetical protein